MYIKKLLLISLTSFLFVGCTNDSSSDLINLEPLPEVVTFNADIVSVVGTICIQCHGATPIPGTNLSLDTDEKVKEAVVNRNLIGRISMQEGSSSLMPQGGPNLPQSTIDKFVKWQADGLQE